MLACPIGSIQNVIGQVFPCCKSIVLDFDNLLLAQAIYNEFSKPFLKRLIVIDTTCTEDSCVVINANNYCSFVLMSTWPILALSLLVINPPTQAKKGWLKNAYVICMLFGQIVKVKSLFKAIKPYHFLLPSHTLPLIRAVFQHLS